MHVTSPNSRTHPPIPPRPTYYPYGDATKWTYKTDEFDLYEVPEHDLDGDPLPSEIAARATYNIVAHTTTLEPVVRAGILSLIEDWLVTGIDLAHWHDVRAMVEHYVPATAPYLANVQQV